MGACMQARPWILAADHVREIRQFSSPTILTNRVYAVRDGRKLQKNDIVNFVNPLFDYKQYIIQWAICIYYIYEGIIIDISNTCSIYLHTCKYEISGEGRAIAACILTGHLRRTSSKLQRGLANSRGQQL